MVFVPNKKHADIIFDSLNECFSSELCVIHSNKTQNYRIRSIQQFDDGVNRILVSTDVMARGLDLNKITHVINFDTPRFSENYMHRIGRTGRAEEKGKSILFYTDKEEEIIESVDLFKSFGVQYILLHCNSTYPAPFKDINLEYMNRLKKIGNCTIGYSGHERDIFVSVAAVASSC